MEIACLSKRIMAAVAAAVALCACALAVVPGVAHADEGTRIAIVQGTQSIGSADEYYASLGATGYTARAAAQVLSNDADDTASEEASVLCGNALNPTLPEGLVFRPTEAAPQTRTGGQSVGYQVGETRSFVSIKGPEFTAQLVAVGDTYTIWVQEGYDLFPGDDLDVFANELDEAIHKIYQTFGTAEEGDLDGDGKVALVFHDFGDNSIAGYFWMGDMFSREQLESAGWASAGSTNHMDMLHLNTVNQENCGFTKDGVMPTLVHELQHLVNFIQTGGDSDTWLNEAFSQAAEAVTGYAKQETNRVSQLWGLTQFAVGVPFVFEEDFVPLGSVSDSMSQATYAHWHLFSRYLANQTQGFTGDGGRLAGGDNLYASVFNYERDPGGFGTCTKDTLIQTLEAIGYLGEGPTCVVKDFDELLLSYATALLVRDKTGPCSLTNNQNVNPSLVDGLAVPLLEVQEQVVSEGVYGGGAAVYVELDRAEAVPEKGKGVVERIVNSPLPLLYKLEASPASGSVLRSGDPISFDSPQFAMIDNAHFVTCAITAEEYDIYEPAEWTFQAYQGSVAFDADRPIIAVRLVCDRGEAFEQCFFYEADTSDSPSGTEVAIVQGMKAIGSDEEYDESLKASGYAPKTSTVQAFSAEVDGMSAEGLVPCGTSLAPDVPEGLDLPMPAPSPLSLGDETTGQSVPYQVGDICRFSSFDRGAEFDAHLAAVGQTFTIWIEEGYDLFEDDDLAAFANELDVALKKIYQAFGTAERVDIDRDNKVAFVFHKFAEEMEYAAGYFWRGDLYTKEELEAEGNPSAAFTNHLDMLHLSTENSFNLEGEYVFDRNYVMGTLVHEFQHLVNFSQVERSEDTWLNEAFSQAAVALTGYGSLENSYLQEFWTLVRFGVGVPFVFEGQYVPTDYVNSHTRDSTYGQWYVFSRYLANQTKGFTSKDGVLRGGDELYWSVFECDREGGLGACTKTSLIHTLEKIGYLGQDKSCVVKDFDELLLNYNTALLMRDTTGPWSLTNDQSANPSLIDGSPLPLLEVIEGAVPEAVYGGGAAVYVELDRAEVVRKKGDGVEERCVNSPLPLLYKYEISPFEGSMLCEGDPISIRAVEPTAAEGFTLTYCTLTPQEWLFLNPIEWNFQEYQGPLAFDVDRPVVGVQLSCDRGSSFHTTYYFEADTSDPGEDPDPGPGGDDPKPEPDLGDTGELGDEPADEVVPPAKGDGTPDDTGDSRGATAIAPTGDSLTPVGAALATAAFVSAIAAVTTGYRCKNGPVRKR